MITTLDAMPKWPSRQINLGITSTGQPSEVLEGDRVAWLVQTTNRVIGDENIANGPPRLNRALVGSSDKREIRGSRRAQAVVRGSIWLPLRGASALSGIEHHRDSGSAVQRFVRVGRSGVRSPLSLFAALIAVVLGSSGCRAGRVASADPSLNKPERINSAGSSQGVHTNKPKGRAIDQSALPPSADARSPIEEHAQGFQGAVSSAEGNASEVGLQVLRDGGNAVDAAVAVAFALGVTHPNAGNIGGGGFMIISTPQGEHYALDYREQAPGAAFADMYLDRNGKPTRKSTEGPLAAGIPGNVAGLGLAHERFGTLPWDRLLAPAIALAKKGWVLDSFHADDLEYGVTQMRRLGYEASADLFTAPDKRLLKAGERFFQPALARTLETIAQSGWKSFYQGELARTIVKEERALGGNWTTKDLKNYRAIWREPIVSDYRGLEIISMPPPSAGGVVLTQMLHGAEQHGLAQRDWDSAERAHLYAEITRRAYVERNQRLGDPDYIDKSWSEMLSRPYNQARMRDIAIDKATPSTQLAPAVQVQESAQTTHFSVVDRSHMAVANTYTLNGNFGAKVVLTKTGIILNNEMDDFTVKPGEPNMFGLVQGKQNAIAPGKRMMSSMTPTIVKKDGALRAVLGSPGGSTITTTVAQILMQIADGKRSLLQAVRAPRMHHQWLPDQLRVEEGVDPQVLKTLESYGHKVRVGKRIGHANCIEIGPDGKTIHAVADTRRDGGHAVAY